MKEQKIKFIIRQDGTVVEEVQSLEDECLNLTKPFEESIGVIVNREYKPEYYSNESLQLSKDQVDEENAITTNVDGDGVSS